MARSTFVFKASGAISGAVLSAALVAAWPASAAFAQGTMYACESGRQFYTINLATGAKTFLGNLSAGNFVTASLTHDCRTQTTYVSPTGGLVGSVRNLLTLNIATRATTAVGPYGDPAIIMHAIEIDSHTGNLYGVSIHNQSLYSISRTTGSATLIGPTGIPTGGTSTFNALGHNPDNGVMYMINTGTASLYTVNLASGAATIVGPLNGPIGCGAMAYNIDNHTMYFVDNDLDNLHTVNLNTGAASLIGPTGVGNVIGLVYVTPTCPPPPPLCVADVDDGSGTGTPDNGVTIDDLLYYLRIFEEGAIAADVDDGSGTGTPDGGVTIDDLLYFLQRFEAGC